MARKTPAKPATVAKSDRPKLLNEVDPRCLIVAEYWVEGLEVVGTMPTPELAKAFVMGFNTARNFDDPGRAYIATDIKVKPCSVVLAACEETPGHSA